MLYRRPKHTLEAKTLGLTVTTHEHEKPGLLPRMLLQLPLVPQLHTRRVATWVPDRGLPRHRLRLTVGGSACATSSRNSRLPMCVLDQIRKGMVGG